MSGAEVIGLISALIGVTDAILKVYAAAQDTAGLPSSFRQVVRRMPLLKDTLLAARDGVEPGENEDHYAALKDVLEACEEKATSLEKVFQAVIVQSSASRSERYAAAMRTWSKGSKVEELMDGILADIQVLTANYSIKAATRSQVRDLINKIQDISADSSENHISASINNYGTGPQSIHVGQGDQNVNTGSGSQLSGTFTGPFNFSSPVIR